MKKIQNDKKGQKKKKVVKKKNLNTITFNKYAIYFQTASILLAIAAIAFNLCDCIGIELTIDLFGLSILFLAFSLFPKKEEIKRN